MIGGLTEFDEKGGRELFAEIMEGVNFGHALKRRHRGSFAS